MLKRRGLRFWGWLAALNIITAWTPAWGDMLVHLKDGRTVTVPVNKEDIVGLTFEDKPRTDAGGIAWNFESGDLTGWTTAGDAFAFQPTYGDNPTARNRGQPSRHEGAYWIGGYEKRPHPFDPPGQVQGDEPRGMLTSKPFKIASSRISFLLGGGCDINAEYVELIVDGASVLKATGKCTETMERVTWDVSPYLGRTAQIRLVDASSGGWGHINFDDAQFH